MEKYNIPQPIKLMVINYSEKIVNCTFSHMCNCKTSIKHVKLYSEELYFLSLCIPTVRYEFLGKKGP